MNFLKVRLNARERIVLQRVIFGSISFVIVFFMLLSYTLMYRGANYPAPVIFPAQSPAGSPQMTNAGVSEPEFSYDVVKLTFGGTCTSASMFGSNSFGTFGSEFDARGAGYFLDGMTDIFSSDDMTLVGLNAVLSDSDNLETSVKEKKEWFLSGASSAEIYSLGGVDAVSLECERAKDYGLEGYLDTKSAVENVGIAWGDSVKAIYRKFDTGLSAAFYCTTLRKEDAEGIVSWIEGAAEKNNFVALYITDSESGNVPSETKRTLFREYIDAGADIVIGSNGECLQQYEEYGGGVIVYSLGALIDGASKYAEKYSAVFTAELRSRNGEMFETVYDIVPIVNYSDNYSWHPVPAEGVESTKILAFMRGESKYPDV